MFGNKTNLLLIAVLVILIDISESGVFITRPATNPAYPNKCYDEKLKKAFAVGESYNPEGECASVTCQPDFTFYGKSCSITVTDNPRCRNVGYQLERGYPDCCQIWECTEENGNIYRM